MGLLENTIGAMIGSGGGRSQAPSSGGSPYGALATALIGLLAVKAATGGFGNLGGMLGGQAAPAGQPAQPQGQGQGQAQPAQAPGGGLLSGLGGLLQQFQQNGHGNLMNSWVGTGQNTPASPNQISQALGPDTVRQLAQQTGVPEDQVAAQLSEELPHVVDKLTPQGRLPTHDEVSAWH